MTSVTIQHFHENIEAAEQASATGPVFITENGTPKHVLIDIEDYRRILEARPLPGIAVDQIHSAPQSLGASHSEPVLDMRNLADLLAVPENEYFEWEPERLYITFRPLDLD